MLAAIERSSPVRSAKRSCSRLGKVGSGSDRMSNRGERAGLGRQRTIPSPATWSPSVANGRFPVRQGCSPGTGCMEINLCSKKILERDCSVSRNLKRLPQRKPFHGHAKNSEKTFSAKKPVSRLPENTRDPKRPSQKETIPPFTIRILETLSPQTVSAGI